MDQLNIALSRAVTGATVLVLGLFSNWIKRSLKPVIAVLGGMAIGPYALRLLAWRPTR